MSKITKEEGIFITEHYSSKTNRWISEQINKPIKSIKSWANYRKLKKVGYHHRAGNLAILLDGSIQSAYWLGLFVADGNMNDRGTFRILQASKDASQIDSLAEYIGTYVRTSKRGDSYVEVTDKQVGPKINALLGVDLEITTKTHTRIDLGWLQGGDHARAFLAGFISGDGCLDTYKDRCCIQMECAPEYFNFFHEIKNKIPELVDLTNIRYTFRNREKQNERRYSKMLICKSMCQALYNNLKPLKLPLNGRKWLHFNDT